MTSDTPRTDYEQFAHEDGTVVMSDFARQLEREFAKARKHSALLTNTLLHAGFVRCDILACNCGGWHHRYGWPERMHEIREALQEAEVLDNSTGNLPLNAIKKLHAQRDEARKDAERLDELQRRYIGADFAYGEGKVSVLLFDWQGKVVMHDLRGTIDAAMETGK